MTIFFSKPSAQSKRTIWSHHTGYFFPNSNLAHNLADLLIFFYPDYIFLCLLLFQKSNLARNLAALILVIAFESLQEAQHAQEFEHADEAQEVEVGCGVQLRGPLPVIAPWLRCDLKAYDHKRRDDGDEVNNNQQLRGVLHAVFRRVQMNDIVDEEEEGQVQLYVLQSLIERAVLLTHWPVNFVKVGLERCGIVLWSASS